MSLPDHTPTRLSDIDWRWALPRIALVFVVTRLLVLAVAVVAEVANPGNAPLDYITVDDRPILSRLTAWDGAWYTSIAESGYHAEVDRWPDYAFFPLYAVVIRVASILTLGDVALASVLVANAAFAAALVVFYALSVRYLTRERAMLGLWFLALAPGAFAFALAYSEGLFLLLALVAFLAAESRRSWIAGIALAAATLTRTPGILLVLPLLVLYVSRDGLRPKRSWLPLLLAPLAMLGWNLYVWWLTGDPLGMFHAQAYWDVPNLGAAMADVSGAWQPMPLWPIIGIYYALVIGYAFLLVYVRTDRLPLAYVLVLIMAIASVFLVGRLDSAVRYLVVAWPAYWLLANRQSRVGRGIVLAAFVGIQVMLMWYVFTWHSLP